MSSTNSSQKKNKSHVECGRKLMNFSSIKKTYRFDKENFDGNDFIENLFITSPKLITLLDTIYELDKKDILNEKKLYKHFIFSDLKGSYGAKIITSGFLAAGYELVMTSSRKRIVLDDNKLKNSNPDKFAVLSSTSIWNSPINQKTTKDILSVFNDRSKNIYGQQIRFIILDSGFKEGVDLFDVKYAHIFEDQMSEADLTQAVGRGTRFCGQKGLDFKNGWDLQVFNYKSIILKDNNPIKILDELKKENKALNFNITFEKDIADTIKDVAIDKLLNKNINELSSRTKNKKNKKIIIPKTRLAYLNAILKYKKKFPNIRRKSV